MAKDEEATLLLVSATDTTECIAINLDDWRTMFDTTEEDKEEAEQGMGRKPHDSSRLTRALAIGTKCEPAVLLQYHKMYAA